MNSVDDQPSSSHTTTSPKENALDNGDVSNLVDDECPNCESAKETCKRAMFQCLNLSTKLGDFERLRPENEELLQRVGKTDKYVLELLEKYDDSQASVSSLQTQLDAALVREKDIRRQFAILEGKQEQFDEAVRKASNNQEKLHRITNAANQVRQKAEEQYQTIDKLNGIIMTQQKKNDELKSSMQKLETEKSLWKSQISSGKKYLPPLFEVINELACAEGFPHLSLKIRKKIDKIKQSDAQMILLGTSGRTVSDDEAARTLEMLMLNDSGEITNDVQNTLLDDGNIPSLSITKKESTGNDSSSKKRGHKDVGRGKSSKPQTMDINILNQNAEIALQKKVNRGDSVMDAGVSTSTIHGRKLPSVKEQQHRSNALSVKERVKLLRENLVKNKKESLNASSHVFPRPHVTTTQQTRNTSSSRSEEPDRGASTTALNKPSDDETIVELVQYLLNKTASSNLMIKTGTLDVSGFVPRYASQVNSELATKATVAVVQKVTNTGHTNRYSASSTKKSLEKQISGFLEILYKEIGNPIEVIECWPEILNKLSLSTHAGYETVQESIPVEDTTISRLNDDCDYGVVDQNDIKGLFPMATADEAEFISYTLEPNEAHSAHVTMDEQLPETSFARSAEAISTEQDLIVNRPGRIAHERQDIPIPLSPIRETKKGKPRACNVEQAEKDLRQFTSTIRTSTRSRSVIGGSMVQGKPSINQRSSDTANESTTNIELPKQICKSQLLEMSDTPVVTRMRTRTMSKCSSEKPDAPTPEISKQIRATPDDKNFDTTIEITTNNEVAGQICNSNEEPDTPRVTRHSRSVSRYPSRRPVTPARDINKTIKDAPDVNGCDTATKISANCENAKQICQSNKGSDTSLLTRSPAASRFSENPDPTHDSKSKKKVIAAKGVSGKISKRKLDFPEIHKVDSVAFKAGKDVSTSRRLSANTRKSRVPSIDSSVELPTRRLRSNTPNVSSDKKNVEPLILNDSALSTDDEPGTLMIVDENINTNENVPNVAINAESQNDTINNLIGDVSSEDEASTSKELSKNLPSGSSDMSSILPVISIEKRSKAKVSIRSSLQSAMGRRADLKTVSTRLTKQMNSQRPKVAEVSSSQGKRNAVHKVPAPAGSFVHPSAAKLSATMSIPSIALKRKSVGVDTTARKKVRLTAENDGSVLKAERLLDAVLSLSSAEMEKLSTERVDDIQSIDPAEYVEAFCKFLLKRSTADHWFFIDAAFKKKLSKSEIQLNNKEEAMFLENAVSLIGFDQSLFWLPLARELVKVIICRASLLHSLYARVIRITAHCLRFNRTLDASGVPGQAKSLLESLFLDIIDRNDAEKIMVFFLICFDQEDISFLTTGDYLKQLQLLSDTSKSHVISWAFKLAFPDSHNVTLDPSDRMNFALLEESILNSLESNSFTVSSDGNVQLSEKLLLSLRNCVQVSVKAYFHQNYPQRKNMREKWASNLRSAVDELHKHFRNSCGSEEVFADSVPSAMVLEDGRSWHLACILHVITATFVDLYSLGNEGKSFITGISDQLMPCLSVVREIRISIKHAGSETQTRNTQMHAILEHALNNFCKFCQRLTRFPIEP